MANGQNDTTVYYSKHGETVTDLQDASHYEVLTKVSQSRYSLKYYYKNKKKWEELDNTIISLLSDSTFQIEYPKGKIIRFVKPKSSKYYVRDLKDNKLIREGDCKLVFPQVIDGNWKEYSSTTGGLIADNEYLNNRLISNKYWIKNLGYINDVFSQVDSLPIYGNGDADLYRFIFENIQYPKYAKENNITGRVIITFVVLTDGSVKGAEVFQTPDPYLADEALRIVNSLPPKWKPGTIGDRKVNTKMSIPISFSLR